jgi:group I intron endonuclease
MFHIYLITNIINNKKYVGYTSNIKNRWKIHIYDAFQKNLKLPLYRSMRKHGIENFTIEIIFSSPDKTYTLNYAENYFIIEHNSYFWDGFGYNMTLGGQGGLHRERSIDWKNTHSQFMKTHNPMQGKNHTEQTKNKMKESAIARHKNIEYQKKVKYWTTNQNPTTKFWIISDPNDTIHEIFSLKKFCKEHNIPYGALIMAYKEKRKIKSGWYIIDSYKK